MTSTEQNPETRIQSIEQRIKKPEQSAKQNEIFNDWCQAMAEGLKKVTENLDKSHYDS